MKRLGTALGCLLLTVTALASAAPGAADDDAFRSAGGQHIDASELTRAAARAGTTSGTVRDVLAGDRTARLAADDRVWFADTFQSGSTGSDPAPRASAPLNRTFLLHSRPSSRRTIYLDFTGERVCNTAWNGWGGCINATRFDTDGRTGFSAAERRAIQSIWRRTVEDYAPFDVDITTERPTRASLTRSGPSDRTFGVHAVITSSDAVRNRVCGGPGCGGVAFLGVFNKSDANANRVLWVFPREVGSSVRRTADIVSHEAGHTLGLRHDGTARSGYYPGHGIWAPIMGASAHHLIQWSRGEYAGADNHQDDLAVIAAHGAARLPDDHADGRARATPLRPGRVRYGRLTGRRDVDMFRLRTTCRAPLAVRVDNATYSPNVDVSLALINNAGRVVARRNPLSSASGIPTGLDASYRGTPRAGVWYLRVDGVGARNPRTSGYSDYGSVGTFRIRFNSRCGAR